MSRRPGPAGSVPLVERRPRRVRRLLTAGLVLLLVALALALPGRGGDPPGTTAPLESGAAPRAEPLPFDLPPPGALQALPRKAFAHYFPPLPVSLDDEPPAIDYYARNYLTVDGEDGKHRDYGGYLRDRPLPRAPRPEPDWRLRDMQAEVRQALAGGLDGFAVDVLQLEGGGDPKLWDNVELLLQAAHDVDPGFEIMIMPDMSGGLVEQSPAAVARAVAELAGYDAAYRLPDGRLVVAPFKAEGQDAGWWREFLDQMRTVHDEPVAFLPVFLDERPHAEAFAPLSWGMSIWGSRSPRANDEEAAGERVAAVRARDQRWMQPVSVQDERPGQGVYDEAENLRNLRATWRIARGSRAELVQLVTWNDYSEGTQLAPSQEHGWSFLDVNAYYLAWWKTGEEPRIVRDTVYVTHRRQPHAAEPTTDHPVRMRLREGSSPARDTVEALTFLTAPGRVTVTSGSRSRTCEVDAGVDVCLVDLAPGRVSAQVVRGDEVVTAVVSPTEVTRAPRVQDLQYVAASSGRDPAAPAPAGSSPSAAAVASGPARTAPVAQRARR